MDHDDDIPDPHWEQRENSTPPPKARVVGRPFPPGVSGNPTGRPKSKPITDLLRDLLMRGEINGLPIKDGKRVADMVAETLIRQALKGDIRHCRELLDRVEGKATENIQISGPEGGAIQVDAEVRHQAKDELIEWRRMMRESLNGRASDDPSSTPSA